MLLLLRCLTARNCPGLPRFRVGRRFVESDTVRPFLRAEWAWSTKFLWRLGTVTSPGVLMVGRWSMKSIYKDRKHSSGVSLGCLRSLLPCLGWVLLHRSRNAFVKEAKQNNNCSELCQEWVFHFRSSASVFFGCEMTQFVFISVCYSFLVAFPCVHAHQ